MAEKAPPTSYTTPQLIHAPNGVVTSFSQPKANVAANPPGASAMVNLAKIASSGSNSNMQIISTPGRPKTVQTLRPVAPGTSQLRPLQGATIALPAGLNLPPGTVLMQNEKGQLVIVSRPTQQQAQIRQNLKQPNQIRPQQIRPNSVPIVASQTGAVSTVRPHQQVLQQQRVVASKSKTTVINNSGAVVSAPPVKPLVIGDDVRKCKNFLETLLRLSSQQPPETYKNVQKLIQGLLDASVAPENFTDELQKELKSQKQPGLAPFLKKSLPDLRKVVRAKQLSITGLSDEWIIKLQEQEKDVKPPLSIATRPVSSTPSLPSVSTRTLPQPPMKRKALSPKIPPISIQQRSVASSSPLISSNVKNIPTATSTSLHHTVNVQPHVELNKIKMQPKIALNKMELSTHNAIASSIKPSTAAPLQRLESQYTSSTNPEIQNTLLQLPALHQKLNSILFQKGMRQMSSNVLKMLSESCRERLHHVISETVVAAEHRLEIYRTNHQFKPTDNVRSKLKFLEGLERLEKKRKDEVEREALLRVAKSRTKVEDPEQAKLKLKAKEMQQAELEVARQRDANLTALAAIGPRKRKQLDISGATSSQAGAGSDLAAPISSQDTSSPQAPTRARLKRLNLRDIQYVTEHDKYLSKSTVLYKSHIR